MLLRRSLVWIGIVFLLLLSLQILSTLSSRRTILYPATRTSVSKRNAGPSDASSELAIHPGGLPSYTGWARSERTLAPFFRIVSFPASATIDSAVTFRLACTAHSACVTAAPRFFVRAYGPSIIMGQVSQVPATMTADDNSQYDVVLRPVDPGNYHVEVVLTFSNLPNLHSYPLPDQASYHQFLYEGYHVAGSPFDLRVGGTVALKPHELPLCTSDELQVKPNSSNNDKQPNGSTVITKARWRVVDIVNSINHQQPNLVSSLVATNVTLQGYQSSLNSIGVVLDYQFENCRLMPEPTAKISLFQCVQEPIHIILIGDSNFRLQEKLIRQYVAFNHFIRVSFLELYGGYFKTQILTGPHVAQFLTEAAKKPERRIVLFNTGLHDIHRLCGGDEMIQDRSTYLRDDMPRSCVELYKMAISNLASDISTKLPTTDVKIFQTSTAAWPKYGNFGVSWDPRYGQTLPLDTSFVEYFNEQAAQILQQRHPDIKIMDGYHVSYARPDHREIDVKSAIGKKLSHPGDEVISAMVRMWSMLFLQQVCH